MTEQMSSLTVQRSVTVQGPPARAFAIFTESISAWWPLSTHTIGDQPATAAVIEPRTGGRWFERAADGTETDWGRVLAWEPPHRLLLSWEISCEWHHDPTIASEVEVSFHAHEGDRTRVDLEHRGLDAYGAQAEQMRDTFGSDGGWRGLLERFAAAASETA
jgi:uncharacterized protein YndB with AHSA1/START domain